MNLKIFSWNFRGLSKPHAMDRIRNICDKINHCWHWAAIPSNGFSGGIIMLWKRDLGRVTPVVVSRFALHLVISSNEETLILTTIYNSQILFEHKGLWKSLSKLSHLSLPWLLNGDFNAIIDSNKHKGGSFRNYALKSSCFSNFITNNNLHDLAFSGPRFIWCNGQKGLARHWVRLDRFLSNTSWLLLFKDYSNFHLPKTNFDHSSMLLSAFNTPSLSKNIFCFDNFWLDYEGCHNNVISAWANVSSSSSPLHSFMHSISRTKFNLCRWKKMSLSHLDKELNSIQGGINKVEQENASQLDDWHATRPRALYNHHKMLIRQ